MTAEVTNDPRVFNENVGLRRCAALLFPPSADACVVCAEQSEELERAKRGSFRKKWRNSRKEDKNMNKKGRKRKFEISKRSET